MSQNKGFSRSFSLAVWVVVIFLVGLLAWGLWTNDQTLREIDAPAPEIVIELFEGYELEGESLFHLHSSSGRVIVVNFWGSWCIACIAEAAELEEAWQTYKDDEVIFIGVAYLDIESQSLKFLTEHNITYPNGLDIGSRVAEGYAITGAPETFIIAKDGRLAEMFIRPVTAEELAAAIEPLLLE